jgi:hypothetical protein
MTDGLESSDQVADNGRREELGLATGVFCGWLGFRSFRVGVYVRPGVLIVNNWFRTRTLHRSQIAEINVMPRREGEDGLWWRVSVELMDGSSIWISAIDCGKASPTEMPKPDRVAVVDEIRRLLDVGGS